MVVVRSEGLLALWPVVLIALGVLALTWSFRVELAAGIGTVSLGVPVVVLSFLAEDVAPVDALVLWVVAIILFAVLGRQLVTSVVYAGGAASLAGSAFVLVESLDVRGDAPGYVGLAVAVVSYSFVFIGTEWLLAALSLRALGGPPVRLRWDRAGLVVATNISLCFVGRFAHDTAVYTRIDVGYGLDVRSLTVLLLIALVILAVSQFLRRRRVERKLGGVIGGSLALPWGGRQEIFDALELHARTAIPSASSRIDSSEGAPHEISARVVVPAAESRFVVLTRRPDSPGFSELEGQTLKALAHIASQSLYDRRLTSTLRAQATTDPLTGVFNLRGLYEALDHADPATQRAVLYMDLDGFKRINDEYGHYVGNVVLEAVAQRIRSTVRSTDLVARVGGDEFLAVVDQAHADRVGERIRELVEQEVPTDAGTVLPRISIGAPVPLVIDAVDLVMRDADHAMYDVKAQRRTNASLAPQLRSEAVRATKISAVMLDEVIDLRSERVVARYAQMSDVRAETAGGKADGSTESGATDGALDVLLETYDQAYRATGSGEDRRRAIFIDVPAALLESADAVDEVLRAHGSRNGMDLYLVVRSNAATSASAELLLETARMRSAGVRIGLHVDIERELPTAALGVLSPDFVSITLPGSEESDSADLRVMLGHTMKMMHELKRSVLVSGIRSNEDRVFAVDGRATYARGPHLSS